ncbi:MAG TPA: GTP-binding protein, partial [Geminicoccaceae bacterium]
ALEVQRAADPALDHDSPLEELFEEQLGAADLVVLNKADLLAADDWPAVEDRVRLELRPGVGLVRAAAALPMDLLIGLGAAAENDLASRPSHHDDEEDHDHDEFESFHLELPALDDPDGFVARVRAILGQQNVLRLKGFLAVRDKPMRLVLQGVGDRIQHYFDRPWGPDETREGRLVVIGERGLDRKAIAAALRG